MEERTRRHPLAVLFYVLAVFIGLVVLFFLPVGPPKGAELIVVIPVIAVLFFFIIAGWLVWLIAGHVHRNRA